jgi:hypothetical protein
VEEIMDWRSPTESLKEYEEYLKYRKRVRAIDTIVRCSKDVDARMPDEVTTYIKQDNLDWLAKCKEDIANNGGYHKLFNSPLSDADAFKKMYLQEFPNMDNFKEYCKDQDVHKSP